MLVVADDLSGAVEVASVLGARRIALGHADGDVIDLDTRELPPEEAARRIRALDGRITFKKIDSLLRGNVQAEIEALSGEVIVAPALPVEGRTVRDGVLHVHGVPQPTPPIELLDAETDEDLDAIVAAAPPDATLVGSAGLAAALGRRLGATPLPQPDAARRPAARRRRHPRRRRAGEATPRRRGDPRDRGGGRASNRRGTARRPRPDRRRDRPPHARRARRHHARSRSPRSTTAPSSAARRTAATSPSARAASAAPTASFRSSQACRIAVTMGDGAGIGPEIVVAALSQTDHETVVIGDRKRLEQAAEILGVEPPRDVIDLDLLPARPPVGRGVGRSRRGRLPLHRARRAARARERGRRDLHRPDQQGRAARRRPQVPRPHRAARPPDRHRRGLDDALDPEGQGHPRHDPHRPARRDREDRARPRRAHDPPRPRGARPPEDRRLRHQPPRRRGRPVRPRRGGDEDRAGDRERPRGRHRRRTARSPPTPRSSSPAAATTT